MWAELNQPSGRSNQAMLLSVSWSQTFIEEASPAFPRVMASFPRSLLFFLLIVTVSWQGGECACVDRSGEATTYGRHLLENQREIWWCVDPTHRFPGGLRVHESTCPEGSIEDTQLCNVANPPATDDNCDSSPWVAPTDTRELAQGTLPPYIKYYVCTEGKAWLSGIPGRYTQCIGGQWTTILDQCDEACDPPRDCSEIAIMGFNDSGVYNIIPTGKLLDISVDVYCSLSPEPDKNGWTTVMTVGPETTTGTITASGGGIPSNEATNRFFMGIQHLAALSWDDMNERPLIFRIALKSVTDNKRFYVTYDNVVIERNSPYALSKLGTYHGDAGDAFRTNEGLPFLLDNQNIWWNAREGPHKVTSAGAVAEWYTALQYSQMSLLRLKVRPKDFDTNSSCPPAIGYHSDWAETTELIFPGSRAEGSVISYRCKKPMYAEGSDTTKSVEGNVTCMNTDGVFHWDRLPVLPCALSCPPDFVPNKLKTSCLHFSSNPASGGITSASLFCSRAYNASLGEIEQGEDLVTAQENVAYYTSHVWIEGIDDPGPNINITCEGDCTLTDSLRCLSVSKEPNMFTKTIQECQDITTHYSCQLPAKCPTGFSELDGLCYKLITDYGDSNSFRTPNGLALE
ncbi:uncharacterized protein [Palaemon carinicauda]|uniref:uncharacterized protein n=1 Tax=Palaemon carinicauda TaxID=392227 RepID=UPI0035B596A3